MRNIIVTASAFALALSVGAGAASASQVSGKIESISPAIPMIVLSNGHSYKLAGEAQAAWCQGTNAANTLADNDFNGCASDSNSGHPNLRVGQKVTVVTGPRGVAYQVLVK